MILFQTWLVSTQCRSIKVSRQGLRSTVYFEQKNPDKYRVFDTYRDFPGLPGLEPGKINVVCYNKRNLGVFSFLLRPFLRPGGRSHFLCPNETPNFFRPFLTPSGVFLKGFELFHLTHQRVISNMHIKIHGQAQS